MDLFKGVYSAEDTIAKRHDVVCKGKGERDEEIEIEREETTRTRGRLVEHWIVSVREGL